MIPSFLDVPAMAETILESDTTEVHGIGETGLPTVSPAVGNAVVAGDRRAAAPDPADARARAARGAVREGERRRQWPVGVRRRAPR